ncbi:unnamed protein product [marine sediment metagenome]|uniref:Uncharacterized protein n=1 Tax=marine sediment metagenome TaxID=412755 RepID=X1VHA0_9ZZZZ
METLLPSYRKTSIYFISNCIGNIESYLISSGFSSFPTTEDFNAAKAN